MRVTVKLFAILKDLAGVGEIALEIPPGATADNALALVVATFPAASSVAARSAVAVNLEYAPVSRILNDGDELALIPPVSGG
jgi:molybdopterin converting factor subunit 1